jgi:anti-anti-sigma factor
MDLRQESVGGVTVLEVIGRIDSTTAPAFQEQLTSVMTAPQASVLIDLSRLDYISSAGFRVLLLGAKRAEALGSRLLLCGLSAKVRQLFDLGGFLDLFAISASRQDAISDAS